MDVDEGPGPHDQNLLDEREPELATCPSCGRTLSAHASHCHHCGARFVGQAWQGKVAGQPWTNVPPWVWLTAIIALIALLAWLLR